jgi:hypothetical protein
MSVFKHQFHSIKTSLLLPILLKSNHNCASSLFTKHKRTEEGKKSELCLAVDKKRGPDFPMFQVKVLHLNAPSRNVPSVYSSSASLNLFKLSKESEFLLREKGQINGQF